jgi:hypothetical protein
MPRRRLLCSTCGVQPADPGQPTCGACSSREWHERAETKPEPPRVSQADAEAERARILRVWPTLARSIDVVPIEDASGSYALRVRGESSWRIVHVGSGEHESRTVFAETP